MAPTSTSSTSSDASLGAWAGALAEEERPELRPYRTYRETWLRVAGALGRASAAGSKSALRAEVAGESARGEPIWTVVAEPAGAAEATVFVVAGLHAMEHVGVATAVRLLERAASDASPWRRRRLVVVPMANPDGFLTVERGLAAGRRRFWRKNARGVDLNRNFAAFWDRGYYLARLLPGVFAPGDGPLSEPESRAVDAAARTYRPAFAVSLHAFGRWIFLPYAGRAEPPPDLGRLQAIAGEMARCQPRDAYRVRQLGSRSRLFKARGAEIDHFYRELGALSFLVEIGAGPRFSEPSTWLRPYGWFTPSAELLERDVENVVPAVEYLAVA